jgi:hypothetical protein
MSKLAAAADGSLRQTPEYGGKVIKVGGSVVYIACAKNLYASLNTQWDALIDPTAPDNLPAWELA